MFYIFLSYADGQINANIFYYYFLIAFFAYFRYKLFFAFFAYFRYELFFAFDFVIISLHGKELYKNCLLICLQHTLNCIKIDQSLLFAFFVYVIFCFYILYFLINLDILFVEFQFIDL
jgi:hypothetical protein